VSFRNFIGITEVDLSDKTCGLKPGLMKAVKHLRTSLKLQSDTDFHCNLLCANFTFVSFRL